MVSRFTTILALLSCLAGVARASEPLPFGAADFAPSPAKPVGFRADGNGWYPAASPPLE
jgi:hypothetical protein